MHTIRLTNSQYLFCRNCQKFIIANDALNRIESTETFPPDWSVMQIGTSGTFKDKPFQIIGRVRLQLRNDYKNFWAAEYLGDCLWIVESFASYACFTSNWQEYKDQPGLLRAGNDVNANAAQKLTGEYVEKCEAVQYAGELGPWKHFSPGFFLFQAARRDATAIYCVKGVSDIRFLFGEKCSRESLKLTNTVALDEWK